MSNLRGGIYCDVYDRKGGYEKDTDHRRRSGGSDHRADTVAWGRLGCRGYCRAGNFRQRCPGGIFEGLRLGGGRISGGIGAGEDPPGILGGLRPV